LKVAVGKKESVVEMDYKYLSKINSPLDLKNLSSEELYLLAGEIREEIILTVMKNGGHLASNLGAVELTLALLYVFDVPNDIIIWDVSHNVYTYKLLTGRRDSFSTIRQYNGLSGYSEKKEGLYDPFTVGHAGTSISTALGVLCGDEILDKKRKIIAVIGDGGITTGLSYEAINNCRQLGKRLLVILNDNAMSISPTVGALSRYLSELRVSPIYEELRKEVHTVLEKTKIGGLMESSVEKLKTSIKASLNVNIFTALGFEYFGVIDGHNIPLLIKMLKNLKNIQRPVLLHITTKKGKGYKDAEANPVMFHSVSTPREKSSSQGLSYTQVFGSAICRLAQKDKRIVAITAAMADGTGLVEFSKRFPDRFFDVGICEQHAVALASGLAFGGARPIVAIYSTFLQRAYDQIFQEASLQNLPIIFMMDRSGLVGEDGPTHHGVFDIAYLRLYPNIILMAPKDAGELEKMLEFALTLKCPVAIRYPKTEAPDLSKYTTSDEKIKLGKAEILAGGGDITFLAYGSMVKIALDAGEILAQDGIKVQIVNGRFAKPIDAELIGELLQKQNLVITIEEHTIVGGFGAAVLEEGIRRGWNLQKIKVWGIQDRFVTHGARDILLREIGLDAKGLAEGVKSILQKI